MMDSRQQANESLAPIARDPVIAGTDGACLRLVLSTGLKVMVLIFLRISVWPVQGYRGEQVLSPAVQGSVCSVSERKR